jgi:3-hydroxyisobutyrate dehydrogenase-like beta-hydroxyacid dehydrogenase
MRARYRGMKLRCHTIGTGMNEREHPVGIIGTGLMGTACAKRLMGAGFDVLGYDVAPARLSAIKALGGGTAASLAELAQTCERAVLAVFDTAQVEGAVESLAGLAALRAPGRAPMLVLCVSTCDPERIAALAKRVPPDRVSFVESPVSGTSEQTAAGEAVGLVGGARNAVDAARGLLDAICPRWHHLGEAGNGARAKLAINLILGLNRAALAEGLVFAERMGLDPAALLRVARGSAAYSQIMDVKGAKMLAGDFAPHGRIAQSLKDFTLIGEQAARVRQQLPLAEVYAALMRGCVAAGEGDWDNSAVIEEIRRRGP